MAHKDGGDFLAGEKLDDLYLLLDGGYLDDDADFNVEVDVAVSEVVSDQGHSTYKCDQCDKICKSKRGHTRHTKMRHTVEPTVLNQPTNSRDVNKMSEKDVLSSRKLPISNLISILNICAGIITTDMCLPEAKRMIFEHFSISLEEANILWVQLRPLLDEFNGNAERFYTQFYGLLAENILPLKFDDIYQHSND